MITIIIPIYNEEKILLSSTGYFKDISQQAELIFADGGSSDRSIEIAKQCGRVLSCRKGRAAQMNHGAAYATGETLLFLHADNHVNPDTLLAVESQVNKNGILGGCFSQRIEKKGAVYRIIESQGNIRARLSKVFYGDQGIFVKKSIFSRLGGFPEVSVMEDVLFTKKLRRMGKTIVLPDRIFVSARRWDHGGIIRTFLRYHLINISFKIGVPLEKISLLYEDIR